MSSLGFHVVLRLGDDRVIAPSRAQRRQVARKLAELSSLFGILAWKLADTHMHIVVLGTEAEVTELVRRLRIWFTTGPRPGVPLEMQRRKPIASQSHLESAFHYALRQDEHHGVETDTFQDASALVDILGLRVLAPELPRRVREHLPRLQRAALLEHLGVASLEEEVHAGVLAEAAMAAFGLDRLGADSVSTLARQAAVAAAPLGRVALATALGVTAPSITRLARAVPPARDVRAVRLQMALRASCADEPLFLREPALSLTYGGVRPRRVVAAPHAPAL